MLHKLYKWFPQENHILKIIYSQLENNDIIDNASFLILLMTSFMTILFGYFDVFKW